MVSRDETYNDVFTTAPSGQSWVRNAYDGAGRLRVSQRYAYLVVPDGGLARRTMLANYAYDALGRRVSVRTMRDTSCTNTLLPGYDCLQTMDYFIWDGADLLVEHRTDGTWTFGPPDTTTPPDSGPATSRGHSPSAMSGSARSMTISRDESGTMPWGDFFGSVRYTHATGVLGIDAPLLVQKSGGVAFVPQATWHGTYADGTNLDGTEMDAYTWPARQEGIYLEPDARIQPVYANAWYGSLLDGKLDANGMVYDRNRYYDPSGGRFTQEDPIGLAGGLNLYGYAGGDPANSSDPFGLCPDPKDPKCQEGTIVSAGASAEAALVPGANVAVAANYNTTTDYLTLTLKLGGSFGVGASVDYVEGSASHGTLADMESQDMKVAALSVSTPVVSASQGFDTGKNWARTGPLTVGYGAGYGLILNATEKVFSTPAINVAPLRAAWTAASIAWHMLVP